MLIYEGFFLKKCDLFQLFQFAKSELEQVLPLFTYEATWKSDSATTTPSDNKPSTGETTSPKTGDTSNIVPWAALLFVSCGALAGTLVIGKKKKTMK